MFLSKKLLLLYQSFGSNGGIWSPFYPIYTLITRASEPALDAESLNRHDPSPQRKRRSAHTNTLNSPTITLSGDGCERRPADIGHAFIKLNSLAHKDKICLKQTCSGPCTTAIFDSTTKWPLVPLGEPPIKAEGSSGARLRAPRHPLPFEQRRPKLPQSGNNNNNNKNDKTTTDNQLFCGLANPNPVLPYWFILQGIRRRGSLQGVVAARQDTPCLSKEAGDRCKCKGGATLRSERAMLKCRKFSRTS